MSKVKVMLWPDMVKGHIFLTWYCEHDIPRTSWWITFKHDSSIYGDFGKTWIDFGYCRSRVKVILWYNFVKNHIMITKLFDNDIYRMSLWIKFKLDSSINGDIENIWLYFGIAKVKVILWPNMVKKLHFVVSTFSFQCLDGLLSNLTQALILTPTRPAQIKD